MRRCNKCGLGKPLTAFYRKTVGTWTGHYAICKECTKRECRRKYATEAYREKHREYAKWHRRKNPEIYEAIKQRYWIRHRSDILERNKTRYRVQRIAREVVARALESGKIKIPQYCEQCGQVAKLHGHHPEYSKPLNIVWLCRSCHGIVHRQYPVTA